MSGRSRATFEAGIALLKAAAVEARVEHHMADARIQKLKAVAELERAGRMDEARVLLDQVRAEREAAP